MLRGTFAIEFQLFRVMLCQLFADTETEVRGEMIDAVPVCIAYAETGLKKQAKAAAGATFEADPQPFPLSPPGNQALTKNSNLKILLQGVNDEKITLESAIDKHISDVVILRR